MQYISTSVGGNRTSVFPGICMLTCICMYRMYVIRMLIFVIHMNTLHVRTSLYCVSVYYVTTSCMVSIIAAVTVTCIQYVVHMYSCIE